MCGTEGNTRICILDNLFDCQQPKGKEENIIVYKFKNSITEKTLP